MRTKDSRRRQDRRRGSTIVEFSLAFTAFIMLLMGMMEFGRAVWTFSTLSHAVSQGARYAAVHGSGNPVMVNGNDNTATAIADLVKANSIGLDPSQVTVNTAWSPNNDRGSEFTITASYPLIMIMGSVFFSGGTLTINDQANGVVLN
jgi:Flp pilus assembly protein TadG